MEKQVNNPRESWCTVELSKAQSWCKAERKHFQENFQSIVFSPPKDVEVPPRCQWKVDEPSHREKRHFKHAYSCQLNF